MLINRISVLRQQPFRCVAENLVHEKRPGKHYRTLKGKARSIGYHRKPGIRQSSVKRLRIERKLVFPRRLDFRQIQESPAPVDHGITFLLTHIESEKAAEPFRYFLRRNRTARGILIQDQETAHIISAEIRRDADSCANRVIQTHRRMGKYTIVPAVQIILFPKFIFAAVHAQTLQQSRGRLAADLNQAFQKQLRRTQLRIFRFKPVTSAERGKTAEAVQTRFKALRPPFRTVGAVSAAVEYECKRMPQPMFRHTGQRMCMMRLHRHQRKRMLFGKRRRLAGAERLLVHIADDQIRHTVREIHEAFQHLG